MASSNKVVVVQTDAFGVAQVVVKVLDNRKVLTSWLAANAALTNPDNGDSVDEALLREAVDVSFQNGTPLRYNTNYLVSKWISGTVEGGNVIVRKVLQYSGSFSDLKIEPLSFSPSTLFSTEALTVAFKMKREKLERARVVSSVEPFGEAVKAGFVIGDVFLMPGKKTELALASEKKPHCVNLTSTAQGLVYVGRAMPPTTVAKTPSAKPGFREPPTDFEVADVEDNDENHEKVVKSTVNKNKKTTKESSKSSVPIKQSKDLKAKKVEDGNQKNAAKPDLATKKKKLVDITATSAGHGKKYDSTNGCGHKKPAGKPSKASFLETNPEGAQSRFGWSSHSKAPSNHVFATAKKRSKFQLPTQDIRTRSRLTKTGSVAVSATRDEFVNLSLGVDENSKPNAADFEVDPAEQKRIAELEAEVSFLKQKLSEKEKIDG